MSNGETVDELSKEVLKNGLMLSENTEELLKNYDQERVEESIIDMSKMMIENCNSGNRIQRIAMLTMNIGQRLNSQEIQEFGQQALDQYNEQYGA